ncbi:MAG: DUF3107 domain-containing protein [Acidimicrobiia bacterium]|nr:DUF3107 domain-containing protein [Acidimicrobiia bacterium]
MDVRIGVIQNPKELVIEMADGVDRDKVKADVDAAVAAKAMLWLTDRNGREVAVPTERLAYVELGSPDDVKKVGFGA